jgi:HK97 family phage prohead protease
MSINKIRTAAQAGVFRAQIGRPKAVPGRERTYRFCFSDGSVDRMGDVIDPLGWELGDFNRNPVALFAHDSSAPPIGRASNVIVEGERLMGDIEFAPPEIYGFADTIFKLVGGGYLNAVSVGFLPLDYDWAKDDGRKFGIDFHRQSLLEISVVPVPALPTALIDARAKGIDTRPLVEWAERMLDGGGKVIVPRAELERLRKAAKPARIA